MWGNVGAVLGPYNTTILELDVRNELQAGGDVDGSQGSDVNLRPGCSPGPKDHINIRIQQTTASEIPLVLGLGTRM